MGLSFIMLTIYFITITQYSEQVSGGAKSSNLTSLMMPFTRLERNSTFYCSEVTLQNRYKLEFQQLEKYDSNQFYKQPPMSVRSKEYNQEFLPQLPYFYSLWKTSSILPRLMTPCEHQIYIYLLKTFDEICRKNDIEYMISYGTLLGSYRNHGTCVISFILISMN